jgi:hypothetical protein
MRGSRKSRALGAGAAFAVGVGAALGGARIWSDRQADPGPPTFEREHATEPARAANSAARARSVTAALAAAQVAAGGAPSPDEPRVPVPDRLTAFQLLALDQPGPTAALRHAVTGLLATRQPHLQRCLPPPELRAVSRIDCQVQVTAGPQEATTTGARCDVGEGAPLPPEALRCIERTLDDAAVLRPAAHHSFPAAWEGELPVQVDSK